jgi:NADPH:quinone reductase
MPQTMRSIGMKVHGGPEVLTVETVAVPMPGADEVLIRVEAAGVNRADLHQREGNYPPPPGASPILGLEVSGEIAKLGPSSSGRATGWHVGDPVCALISGGGYAEYCVAPVGQCLPIPKGLSTIEAAALPEATLTVWANLFDPRRLFAGDRFLVQGGSSGIGTMAIQIAGAFGARVAATAGNEEKCKFCLELGAERAVNYRNHAAEGGDWASQIAEWSEPHGVDAILDMIGGDYFAKHLKLLAMDGRLVHIAFAHGSTVTLDLRTVMSKRLIITGSTLRSRSVGQKSALRSEVERQLWPLFEMKRLRPVVFQVFPLDRVVEAHQLVENGQHIGKVLLEMN